MHLGQSEDVNYRLYNNSPCPPQHKSIIVYYYLAINDISLKLSLFWLSDTESRNKELRFSDSVSLPFQTRLTSVTCFCSYVKLSNFQT